MGGGRRRSPRQSLFPLSLGEIFSSSPCTFLFALSRMEKDSLLSRAFNYFVTLNVYCAKSSSNVIAKAFFSINSTERKLFMYLK